MAENSRITLVGDAVKMGFWVNNHELPLVNLSVLKLFSPEKYGAICLDSIRYQCPSWGLPAWSLA